MNLYFFNFSHELTMANGHKNYLPPDVVRTMERDLMPLSAFCAPRGAGAVVDDSLLEPCRRFYEALCPEVRFYSLQNLPPTFRLRPWGWDERLLWTFRKAGATVSERTFSELQKSDTKEFINRSERGKKHRQPLPFRARFVRSTAECASYANAPQKLCSERGEKHRQSFQKDSDVFQKDSDVVSRLSDVVPNLSDVVQKDSDVVSRLSDVVFTSSANKDVLLESGLKFPYSLHGGSEVAASSPDPDLHARLSDVRHYGALVFISYRFFR